MEETVQDIKEYVLEITEKIDGALDRHRICYHAGGNHVEVRSNAGRVYAWQHDG